VSGRRRARALAAALALAAARAGAQDATAILAGTGPSAATPGTSLESYLTQPGRLLIERSHALSPIALEGGRRLLLEAVIAQEPAREHERVLGVRARLAGAEDLASSLASLPAVLESERAQKAAVEIRYLTRDGFGVAVATGRAAPGGTLRFPGAPPVSVPLSEAALGELRIQLDASRRYLFEQ
jgi:hypothetical protein